MSGIFSYLFGGQDDEPMRYPTTGGTTEEIIDAENIEALRKEHPPPITKVHATPLSAINEMLLTHQHLNLARSDMQTALHESYRFADYNDYKRCCGTIRFQRAARLELKGTTPNLNGRFLADVVEDIQFSVYECKSCYTEANMEHWLCSDADGKSIISDIQKALKDQLTTWLTEAATERYRTNDFPMRTIQWYSEGNWEPVDEILFDARNVEALAANVETKLRSRESTGVREPETFCKFKQIKLQDGEEHVILFMIIKIPDTMVRSIERGMALNECEKMCKERTQSAREEWQRQANREIEKLTAHLKLRHEIYIETRDRATAAEAAVEAARAEGEALTAAAEAAVAKAAAEGEGAAAPALEAASARAAALEARLAEMEEAKAEAESTMREAVAAATAEAEAERAARLEERDADAAAAAAQLASVRAALQQELEAAAMTAAAELTNAVEAAAAEQVAAVDAAKANAEAALGAARVENEASAAAAVEAAVAKAAAEQVAAVEAAVEAARAEGEALTTAAVEAARLSALAEGEGAAAPALEAASARAVALEARLAEMEERAIEATARATQAEEARATQAEARATQVEGGATAELTTPRRNRMHAAEAVAVNKAKQLIGKQMEKGKAADARATEAEARAKQAEAARAECEALTARWVDLKKLSEFKDKLSRIAKDLLGETEQDLKALNDPRKLARYLTRVVDELSKKIIKEYVFMGHLKNLLKRIKLSPDLLRIFYECQQSENVTSLMQLVFMVFAVLYETGMLKDLNEHWNRFAASNNTKAFKAVESLEPKNSSIALERIIKYAESLNKDEPPFAATTNSHGDESDDSDSEGESPYDAFYGSNRRTRARNNEIFDNLFTNTWT